MTKTFSVLCGLALVLTLAMVVSVSASTTPSSLLAAAQSAEQTQSVTGTIASVGNNSFTLTVGSATSKEPTQTQTTPRSMMFLIDKNTTVDGKLKVGATADVTYREENGNNIAINVRVASSSPTH